VPPHKTGKIQQKQKEKEKGQEPFFFPNDPQQSR